MPRNAVGWRRAKDCTSVIIWLKSRRRSESLIVSIWSAAYRMYSAACGTCSSNSPAARRTAPAMSVT